MDFGVKRNQFNLFPKNISFLAHALSNHKMDSKISELLGLQSKIFQAQEKLVRKDFKIWCVYIDHDSRFGFSISMDKKINLIFLTGFKMHVLSLNSHGKKLMQVLSKIAKSNTHITYTRSQEHVHKLQ